jgi:hypothetical protein
MYYIRAFVFFIVLTQTHALCCRSAFLLVVSSLQHAGKHTQLLIPLLQQRLRARAVMADVALLLAAHAACAARTWRMRNAHDSVTSRRSDTRHATGRMQHTTLL